MFSTRASQCQDVPSKGGFLHPTSATHSRGQALDPVTSHVQNLTCKHPLSALISHLSRSLFRFPPFQEFFDPDSSTEILLNTRLMFSLPFLANLESMLSLYKPVPFIELQRPGLTSPRCLTHLAKPQPCKMQLCPFSTSSGAAACGEMQMHLHADCAPLRPTKVSPFQRRCKGRRGREGEERKGRGGGNKPPLTTPTSPISLSPL